MSVAQLSTYFLNSLIRPEGGPQENSVEQIEPHGCANCQDYIERVRNIVLGIRYKEDFVDEGWRMKEA